MTTWVGDYVTEVPIAVPYKDQFGVTQSKNTGHNGPIQSGGAGFTTPQTHPYLAEWQGLVTVYMHHVFWAIAATINDGLTANGAVIFDYGDVLINSNNVG